MAEILDQTIPYELLVRFGPDGTPAGAHVQYLRRITLDGVIIKDDVQPAQPVDLAGFPTSDIMSDACRDALAKVTAQVAEIATLNGKLDLSGADLTKARADLATVTADAGDLRKQLTDTQAAAVVLESSLRGQLFSLNDQLSQANATIAQLQDTIKRLQTAAGGGQ
ncbi:hypothetical protein [Rhizobium sp. WW_1]|jgi:hypothetical protein|uniref:hypothetical protein n=1 Tax=Rhizobium sp. WW_1 TaxID=1907375 RepID=UPI00064642FC|nr:hypothetical protein [Rhizobium sp. WW_1]RKD61566.1 hypothetical protein BJ928_107167 [Rhizobium sp. WW_1]